MRRRNNRDNNDEAAVSPLEPGTIRTVDDLLTRSVWEPYFRVLLLLAGIWRNWYWVFPLAFLLVGGTGVLLYKFIPRTYTSSAWIRIAARRPYSIFNEPSESRESYLFFVKTNLAFLKSPDVLEPALHDITVQAQEHGVDLEELIPSKDPVIWLIKNMDVSSRDQSEIYQIAFTTRSPMGSAILANAVTTSYLRYLENYDQGNRLLFTNTISANIDIYKKRIEGLKAELALLTKAITESGGVFPIELANNMIQSDSFLMEAIKAEAMLEMLKREKQQNEELLNPDKEIKLDDSVVESFIDIDPNMIELVREQTAQKMRLDNFRKKLADSEDPAIRNAERKLEDINAEIENLRGELLTEKKKSWVYEMKTKAQQEVLRLGQEIESQEKVYQRFREKYEERLRAMSQGNQDILKATFKQGEIAREEMITSILLDKLNQLNVEKDTPGRITLIQAATPAKNPTEQRLRVIGICLFLVFCVPFCLAWVRELLAERYYHLQQFRINFPETSVRFVPGMPNSGLSTTVTARNRRQVQRSIEEICNELRSGKYFTKSKTLVLSSIEKDDNQSLFTASIAKTMARMIAKPILLLNANFRNERLERILKLDPDADGLPDVLQFKSELNNTLVRDEEIPNLYYLPGGETDESPINLFANGNFELLLEELEKHYEMIIVSAPPLYTSSESYVLAGIADTLIICIRLRDTKRSTTQQVCRKLNDINALPKGFVIS